MTGPTAIGCPTGHIDKFANAIALRADMRRRLCGNKKAAPGAFPVCQSTLRTNISLKLAVSSVTAIGTLRFPFGTVQDFHLTPPVPGSFINFNQWQNCSLLREFLLPVTSWHTDLVGHSPEFLLPSLIFRSRSNDNRDGRVGSDFLSNAPHLKIVCFSFPAHHHHIDLFSIDEFENF